MGLRTMPLPEVTCESGPQENYTYMQTKREYDTVPKIRSLSMLFLYPVSIPMVFQVVSVCQSSCLASIISSKKGRRKRSREHKTRIGPSRKSSQERAGALDVTHRWMFRRLGSSAVQRPIVMSDDWSSAYTVWSVIVASSYIEHCQYLFPRYEERWQSLVFSA